MTHRITIRAEYSAPSPGFYSFIGPVAYYALRNGDFTCQYFCDGMLASTLFSIVFQRRIARTSFDYSSIARAFFEDCQHHRRRVLSLGGSAADAQRFSDHLRDFYPQLRFLCEDGYPPGGYGPETLRSIGATAADFDVVLLALGSPLQEKVGQYLHDQGFPGIIVTAGAFVTQTAATGTGLYYPKLINALHLRFLWRLLREPHTRSRFKYVFMFPFSYAVDRLRGRIEVVCK